MDKVKIEVSECKTPLGLRPKYIADQQRREEILQAMLRYNDQEMTIPDKWIIELIKLNG